MDNNDTVNVNSKLTEPRVWGSGSTVLQVGNAIADEQNAIRRKHDEESKENWSGSIPPKKAYLIQGIYCKIQDGNPQYSTDWFLCNEKGKVYNFSNSPHINFLIFDETYIDDGFIINEEVRGKTVGKLYDTEILHEETIAQSDWRGASFSYKYGAIFDDVVNFVVEDVLPLPTLQLAPLEIGGDNKRIVYYWNMPVFFTIDGQSSPECGVISEEDAQTYVNQKVPMENWDNMYTLPADEFLVKETGDPLEDPMPDKLIADQWTATLISEPIVVHS